jgi:hypothetical protein
MLRRREVFAWSIWALMMVWPLALLGTEKETREPKTPIASLEVQATRIDWRPKVDYELLALTVAGPGDLYIRQEFQAGQEPYLGLLDSRDNSFPDGIYAYELRTMPRSSADSFTALGLREEGKRAARALLQSGYFSIREGTFVTTGLNQPKPADQAKPASGPSPRPVGEKVITTGWECIGNHCGAGDDNVSVLNLKDSVVRIKFEDVFDNLSFDRDWIIQANDSLGGSDRFFIEDFDARTVPFTLEGNARDNSLYVRSNGNVGLGTSTPGARLHVFGSATDDAFASAGPDPASGPALNFGYGGASFGRGAAFLNVRPDASATPPNPSLRFFTNNVQRLIITNAGDIGIGTTNPAAKLEVSGGEVRLPPGAGAAGATHFNFAGDGKNYIRGTTILADTGGSVGIGTTSPSSKLHVNGGDIRVSGGSFIDDGVTLNAPDYVFEPSYRLMPLEQLREFVTQEKHLPNVPTSREVKEGGLNLSQFQMRLLEKVEELTLYTLSQDQRLSSQQDELLRLREQNVLLQQRLAALEKALPTEAPE